MGNDKTNWQDIPGYERVYRISNDGQVMRVDTQKILAKRVTPHGYSQSKLTMHGQQRYFYTHRLVLLAFVGERPDGMEVNHKNGVKTDNRLENLEYVTKQENYWHMRRVLGRKAAKGTESGNAKLNDDKVREIRKLHSSGISMGRIAKLFNVGHDAISRIIHRKTWWHVDA